MDPVRFDRLVKSLSTTSRRSLVLAATGAAGALLTRAGADEALAKKGKKKRKKKKTAPCDPPCGPGVCRDGVCDCRGDYLFACGETCCDFLDDCVNGACCYWSLICAGECCADGEWCVGGHTCCPANRACEDTCCNENERCTTARTCCPNERYCAGDCCLPGEQCAGGECCENPITVRGEQCCPQGSGNNYTCGRFKCVFAMSQTGPGGCDLWCDLSQEGAGCGPSSLFDGTPGIDTGEGNGRICCCTVPGTYTCVWP